MRTTTLTAEPSALAYEWSPGRSRPTAHSLGLRYQQTLSPLSARLTKRRRGTDCSPVSIRYGVTRAWFGECLLAWTVHGICWLSIAPDSGALEELEHTWAPATLRRDSAGAARHAGAILGQAVGPGRQRDMPLHLCGSDFQLEVWAALLQVDPGHYVSYGDLAIAIGTPRAARAVGQAVGANGVAVLVPCHRVLAADGRLGGYRWGSSLKLRLLRHEVAAVTAD